FSTLSLFSSSSASSYFSLFFFYSSGDHRHLHSFPHDALPISWRPEGQNNPTTALSPTRRSRPDISKSPPPSCKISRLCGVRTRGHKENEHWCCWACSVPPQPRPDCLRVQSRHGRARLLL